EAERRPRERELVAALIAAKLKPYTVEDQALNDIDLIHAITPSLRATAETPRSWIPCGSPSSPPASPASGCSPEPDARVKTGVAVAGSRRSMRNLTNRSRPTRPVS